MGLTRPIGSDPPELRGVGTPGYAPPEQAAGLPLDEAADVYALGVVLSEVLDEAKLPLFMQTILCEARAPRKDERTVSLEKLRRAFQLIRAGDIERQRSNGPMIQKRRAFSTSRRRRTMEGWIVVIVMLTFALIILLFLGIALVSYS